MLNAIGTLPFYSDPHTSYLASHPATYCPNCQPTTLEHKETPKTQQKMDAHFSNQSEAERPQSNKVITRGRTTHVKKSFTRVVTRRRATQGEKSSIHPIAITSGQASSTHGVHKPEVMPHFGDGRRGSPTNSPRPAPHQPVVVVCQPSPSEMASTTSAFSFG